MDVKDLFDIAAELFQSSRQDRQNAGFTFVRDVWQLNRIWRALHDPQNTNQEAAVVAELLGLHRNTLYNKLAEVELTMSDLKTARSVPDLIRRSPALRRRGSELRRMRAAERRERNSIQKVVR